MSGSEILVVEDEGVVALDITDQLLRLGYGVCGTAASAERALQLVAQNVPDLVLMDIRLRGDLDGVQAAQQIRDRFQIPVVFLTAHADAPTVERAKAAMPYGYLIKPFDGQELKSTIEITLSRHALERRERAYTLRLEQEIAAREQAERALAESELRYRTLVETSPDAIALIGLDGRLLTLNEKTAELLGYPDVETLLTSGETAFDLLVPSDRERAIADLQRNLQHGNLKELEYTLLRRDGMQVTVGASAAIVRDTDGNPTALVGVVRDITERKQAEANKFALACLMSKSMGQNQGVE